MELPIGFQDRDIWQLSITFCSAKPAINNDLEVNIVRVILDIKEEMLEQVDQIELPVCADDAIKKMFFVLNLKFLRALKWLSISPLKS